MPTSETPRQKFYRIYKGRLDKALKQMKLLQNCSGAGYDPDIEVVKKTVTVMRKAVDKLEEAYKIKSAPVEVMPEVDLTERQMVNIKWAYDMLNRGEIEDAKIMIGRVLSNEVD